MRHTTPRGDFATARFLSAARLVAANRGLMEVSYTTVSEVTGAPRSSIQRRFPTVELLRRTTLEVWLHTFDSAGEVSELQGVQGAWTFVARWLLAHAKQPLPFSLLTQGTGGPAPDERRALATMVSSTLSRWTEQLRDHISAAPLGTWKQDLDASALAHQLAVACFGVGPSAAVVGERVALESAARIAEKLLRTAPLRRLPRSMSRGSCAGWTSSSSSVPRSSACKRRRGWPDH